MDCFVSTNPLSYEMPTQGGGHLTEKVVIPFKSLRKMVDSYQSTKFSSGGFVNTSIKKEDTVIVRRSWGYTRPSSPGNKV